jgi:hypothetical protein
MGFEPERTYDIARTTADLHALDRLLNEDGRKRVGVRTAVAAAGLWPQRARCRDSTGTRLAGMRWVARRGANRCSFTGRNRAS